MKNLKEDIEAYEKIVKYHTEKAEIYKAKIEALKERKKANKKK